MTAPSKLKAVAPTEAKCQRPKILVFGPPGVGKSWLALEFPAPFYGDTEGGATQQEYTAKLVKSGGMYFGPEQGSQDFKEVLGQVRALASEKHSFRTFVLDSGSKLFNDTIAREAERLEDNGKEVAFGNDKKPAVGNMRKLVSWLQRIDMNVIITAHEKGDWQINQRTGQREEVGKTADIWDRLAYELDLTLQVFKQGTSRKARVIKTRIKGFSDGEVFDWSYAELERRFGAENINAAVKTIELPTEEMLTTLYGLMQQRKTPDADKEKWLKAALVSDFAEMDREKVEKLIAHLQKVEA